MHKEFNTCNWWISFLGLSCIYLHINCNRYKWQMNIVTYYSNQIFIQLDFTVHVKEFSWHMSLTVILYVYISTNINNNQQVLVVSEKNKAWQWDRQTNGQMDWRTKWSLCGATKVASKNFKNHPITYFFISYH